MYLKMLKDGTLSNILASTKCPEFLAYLARYFMFYIHELIEKMRNKAWNDAFFVETLQEIGFHT